jgi:hypothetical protein
MSDWVQDSCCSSVCFEQNGGVELKVQALRQDFGDE